MNNYKKNWINIAKTNCNYSGYYGSLNEILYTSIIWYIMSLIVVLAISSWTTSNSNILDAYGGGGKLFGGTYLFQFYLGMLLAAKLPELKERKSMIAGTLIFSVCWISWWNFVCIDKFSVDAKLPFGGGFNPSSITSTVFAIVVLGFCISAVLFCETVNNKYLQKVVNAVSGVGTFSFYIFLYHRLILNWYLERYLGNTSIWMKIEIITCNQVIVDLVCITWKSVIIFGKSSFLLRIKWVVGFFTKELVEWDISSIMHVYGIYGILL